VFSLLDRIWEMRDNLLVYDASYVALAELPGLQSAYSRCATEPGAWYPLSDHGDAPLANIRKWTSGRLGGQRPVEGPVYHHRRRQRLTWPLRTV
jgi:hypothetical protein